MYIAMNKFRVMPGQEDAFEEVWRQRETYLDEVPGFIQFHLLRGKEGVFVSHSTWQDENAFLAWTESEAFQKAHGQGSVKGLLQGPPEFSGFTVVI